MDNGLHNRSKIPPMEE